MNKYFLNVIHEEPLDKLTLESIGHKVEPVKKVRAAQLRLLLCIPFKKGDELLHLILQFCVNFARL